MLPSHGSDERPPEEERRRVVRIEFSSRTFILLILIIPGLWVLNRLCPWSWYWWRHSSSSAP